MQRLASSSQYVLTSSLLWLNRVLLVQSNKSEVLNDWLGERKNHERIQHSVYEQPYANDVTEDDKWNDPEVQPEEAPNQDSFGNREYTD